MVVGKGDEEGLHQHGLFVNPRNGLIEAAKIPHSGNQDECVEQENEVSQD